MKFSMFCLSTMCLFLTACEVGGDGSPGAISVTTSNAKGEVTQWQSTLLGQEGHGGDAIVCFSIPVERALYKIDLSGNEKNCVPGEQCKEVSHSTSPGSISPASGIVWRMTDEGRSSIQSAQPLEQYLAARIASKKLILDQLNQMPIEEGYQKILLPMVNLPAPFNRISEMHQKIGWLHEDGIASEYGLIDINDSGFLNEDEIDKTHCKELQAVVRRDHQLWYDTDILKHFDHAGRVLIQLHEEIYAWGKDQDEINLKSHGVPAHETSTKTRRLILKLIDAGIETKLVNENLKTLGFSTGYWETLFNVPTAVGFYMDSKTCVAEQQFLKNFFKGGNYREDFWFQVESLFSQRYLKSSASWPIIELRNNFPDALSNMIALTMNESGPSDTFVSDILKLQEVFERPESCVGGPL
jgi:hypothetical protein